MVLVVLADAANELGIAWPKVPTIAHRAGMSERHVRDAIAALERLGELFVETQSGKQNRYAFFGPDPIPAEFICRDARAVKARVRKFVGVQPAAPLNTSAPLQPASGVEQGRPATGCTPGGAAGFTPGGATGFRGGPATGFTPPLQPDSADPSLIPNSYPPVDPPVDPEDAREDAATPATEIILVSDQEKFHEAEDNAALLFSLYIDNLFDPPVDNDIFRDALLEAARESTADQLTYAFREAAEAGIRQWRYVKTVLERKRQDDERAAIARESDRRRAELIAQETEGLAFSLASPTRTIPDVPEAINAAWNAAYGQLEMQLDRASFNAYLRDVALIGFEPETTTLILSARTEPNRSMLQNRLYRQIERAVRDAYGGHQQVALRFSVPTAAPPGELPDDSPLFVRLAGVQS